MISFGREICGDLNAARSFPLPFERQLTDHGAGSISGIFDGDSPFHARGCIARAWDAAEVLRAWQLVNRSTRSRRTHDRSTAMQSNFETAQSTIHALHTAARLLGAVRLLVHERQPNFLELGLKVTPDGVSTDTLPGGGEVLLDFRQAALVYQPATDAASSLPLEGQTQADLLEALLRTIHARELAASVPLIDGSPYTDAMFAAADQFANRIKPKRADLSDSTPLHIEPAQSAAYADALYAVFTGVARFRARLNGSMTPVVVWTEHFDLSFLWFTAEPDEHHPHLNFGFAPYSTGIDFPYLYAYAYPYPAQYQPPTLPPGARWNTDGWTGVVLPYDEIARHDDPARFVESACAAVFAALRPLLESPAG